MKITKSFAALVVGLSTSAVTFAGAQERGLFRGGGGGGGFGRGGGFGGGGPGGGFGGFDREFVNITCTGDIDFSCDLPRDDEQGVFVCRSKGDRPGIPICIPNDRAVEGDECGCCGEECPIPCGGCPCDLPFTDRQGVEVLIAGQEEPLCVPAFASARLVYRSMGMVTCNEPPNCLSA